MNKIFQIQQEKHKEVLNKEMGKVKVQEVEKVVEAEVVLVLEKVKEMEIVLVMEVEMVL